MCLHFEYYKCYNYYLKENDIGMEVYVPGRIFWAPGHTFCFLFCWTGLSTLLSCKRHATSKLQQKTPPQTWAAELLQISSSSYIYIYTMIMFRGSSKWLNMTSGPIPALFQPHHMEYIQTFYYIYWHNRNPNIN